MNKHYFSFLCNCIINYDKDKYFDFIGKKDIDNRGYGITNCAISWYGDFYFTPNSRVKNLNADIVIDNHNRYRKPINGNSVIALLDSDNLSTLNFAYYDKEDNRWHIVNSDDNDLWIDKEKTKKLHERLKNWITEYKTKYNGCYPHECRKINDLYLRDAI